jgi:hypothetical protein
MTSCQRKGVDVGTEVEYVCGGREVMVHKLWNKEVRRGRPVGDGLSPFGQVTAGVDRGNLHIKLFPRPAE